MYSIRQPFGAADLLITLEVREEEWRLLGGQRLWHGPEAYPRTYMPDNDPVEWDEIPGGIQVKQVDQPWVQMGKKMDITIGEKGTGVRIVHRITNDNAWTAELVLKLLAVIL